MKGESKQSHKKESWKYLLSADLIRMGKLSYLNRNKIIFLKKEKNKKIYRNRKMKEHVNKNVDKYSKLSFY